MKKLSVIFAFIFFHALSLHPTTLSVLYFDNTTKAADYKWMRKGISDILSTDLARSPKLKLVERENLEKIMKEQQLQLAGVTEDKNAVKIGELLQAQKLLYGSFIVTGDKVRIDAKLSDVESGKIEKSMKVEGDTNHILDLISELSKRVRMKMELEPESQITELKPLAVKNYYQGMDLLDKGAVKKALSKFKAAREADPVYDKPQQGMEEAYRFLKDFTQLRKQRELKKMFDKAAALRKRLREKPFKTYADLLKNANFSHMTAAQRKDFNKKAAPYLSGDTPAQVAWNLVLEYFNIAMKYDSDFRDKIMYKKMLKQAVHEAEKWRRKYKKNKFYPEILYVELMAHRWLEDYAVVKKEAEELMLDYTDYRMMWAVEDFYKVALDHLGKKDGE